MSSTGTILVTGGAGFIGSNFLQLSVPRFPGRTFVNVDKLTYAANLQSLDPVQDAPNYVLEVVDLADAEQLEACFARHRPTLVVHFAAESHVDRSLVEPGEFIRSNVVGTYNLLECFRRHCAHRDGARLHHVSTDEVFGSLGPTGRFTEDSRYDPSSPYSASKAASDHLVRAYARSYGVPVTISTCSNNYGPRQFPEKLVPLMILHALERRLLPVYGRGENVRDWLHVEDHCEAIWAIIERGRVGETYAVGGGHEARNLDVVHRICALVAEFTGASADALRGLVTHVKDRPGHDLRYAIDSTKIQRECAWCPRYTFDAGMRSTVRWYLENPGWVEAVRSGAYRGWMVRNYAGRLPERA